MRMRRRAVLGVGLLLSCSLTAEASTLQDRKQEWALAFSSVKQNSVGTTSSYGLDWSYIVSGGHVQFVGNSAAVHVTYEWGRFQRGNAFSKDQDETSLVVSLALYALKR